MWRHLRQEVSDLLLNNFLTGLALARASLLRPSLGNGRDHLLGLLESEGEIGILVQAEDVRVVVVEDLVLDMLLEDCDVGVLDVRRDRVLDLVLVAGSAATSAFLRGVSKRVVLREDALLQVLKAVDLEELEVEVVGNFPSILNLADHEHEDIEVNRERPSLHTDTQRSDLLIEVSLDKQKRCLKIGVIELVGDAPAEGAELTALLDD